MKKTLHKPLLPLWQQLPEELPVTFLDAVHKIVLSLHFHSELVGCGHELRVLDRALLVHAGSADHAALLAALVAGEKSAQGGERAVEHLAVRVCHREEEVELLVGEVRIDNHRAVYKRLELRRDRIEVNGRGENDHVRRHHFVDDFLRIVLDCALARFLAGVAAGAVADLLVGDAHLLDLVPSLLRACCELVAEDVGIAALPRC